MANNPEIQVEIGAITDKLKKGVDGAILSLSQLEKEAQTLNKALETATDPADIVRLNQSLAQTKQAMVNLRSAGIEPLTRAQSNYNSVGIDFARIIQDAPFGIIGVGNNITQLAGSFQNLKNQTGSASSAIKAGFASIFSSGNLLVLGISAVTTALTLYSQSAQGAKGPIDDLKEAQDNYNDSLKETDRLLGKEVFATFLKEVGLIEKQNIGGRLIDVPTFENAAEVVDKLGVKIKTLRKGELELLAKFFQTEVSEALRDISNNANELGVALAKQDLPLYQGLLDQVNKQLAFYKTNTDNGSKSTKGLNTELQSVKRTFEEISGLPLIGGFRTGDIEALRARFQKIKPALTEGGLNILSPQQLLDQAISNAPGVNTQNTAALAVQKTTGLLEEQRLKVEELNAAFTGLGSLLGQVFGNNPALGQFIGQFVSFAAKLIATNFKIATSNAITGATSAAVATGPAAPFTLPAFIAGAVGVVASAFAAFGGGRGARAGGAGTSGVGSGTSFSGAGATAGSFNRDLALTGEFTIRGTDLVYVIDRSKERISKG